MLLRTVFCRLLRRLPLLAAITIWPGATFAGWELNWSLWLGARELDARTWQRVDDQYAVGTSLDYRPPGWPVSLALTYSSSRSVAGCADRASLFTCDKWEREGQVQELVLGTRKIWNPGSGKTHVYVGAGYSRLEAHLRNDVSRQPDGRDRTGAASLEAGFFSRDKLGFLIGWAVRGVLGADIEFSGVDGEADYIEFDLVVGWGYSR